MISVKNLTFSYPSEDETLVTTNALNGVSFQIEQGEWVAICGHNGSGKSTLARLLDGLLVPDSGVITIDGIQLSEQTIWEIRDRIGMVFQNPENQFVGVTVEDDVAFGLENKGVPQNEMAKKIDNALQLVNMTAFKEKEPVKLSGGQKQRVAIASVLALTPKIIILDEATAMLDPKGRQQIIQVVSKLRRDLGLTVLSITHDIEEALVADRVLVLNRGELVYNGKPEALFDQEVQVKELGLDIPYAQYIKRKLKERGIPLPEQYMTQEELEDWICQYLLTK